MKLAAFGDSWTYGSELPHNEFPYAKYVADHFNADYFNFAQESTSVPHMFLQLQTAIQELQGKFTALFGVTSISRSWYYNEFSETWSEIMIGSKSSPGPIMAYYKYLHSDELDKMNYNIYLLALQKICDEHDIDAYFIGAWNRIHKLNLPGGSNLKIYEKSMAQILGIDSELAEISEIDDNFYIKPNVNHPNPDGHRAIAAKITQWIENVSPL